MGLCVSCLTPNHFTFTVGHPLTLRDLEAGKTYYVLLQLPINFNVAPGKGLD